MRCHRRSLQNRGAKLKRQALDIIHVEPSHAMEGATDPGRVRKMKFRSGGWRRDDGIGYFRSDPLSIKRGGVRGWRSRKYTALVQHRPDTDLGT